MFDIQYAGLYPHSEPPAAIMSYAAKEIRDGNFLARMKKFWQVAMTSPST